MPATSPASLPPVPTPSWPAVPSLAAATTPPPSPPCARPSPARCPPRPPCSPARSRIEGPSSGRRDGAASDRAWPCRKGEAIITILLSPLPGRCTMDRRTHIPFLLAVFILHAAATPAQQPVVAGPGNDYQADIAVPWDAPGQRVLVFERLDAGSSGDLWLTRSDDGGDSWSTPVPIVSTSGNERHPALVQTGPSAWSLFHLGTAAGGYRIFRATSGDGWTFSTPVPIDLGWPTGGEINPHVIRRADGTLVMTYQRLGGAAHIALSSDGGATWDTLRTQVSPGPPSWRARPPRSHARPCRPAPMCRPGEVPATTPDAGDGVPVRVPGGLACGGRAAGRWLRHVVCPARSRLRRRGRTRVTSTVLPPGPGVPGVRRAGGAFPMDRSGWVGV